MKLMGIDPGLSSLGISIVDLAGGVPRVIALNVVRAALRARACPEQFIEGAA